MEKTIDGFKCFLSGVGTLGGDTRQDFVGVPEEACRIFSQSKLDHLQSKFIHLSSKLLHYHSKLFQIYFFARKDFTTSKKSRIFD